MVYEVNESTKYPTVNDLLRDEKLICDFRKSLNNEVTVDEIRAIITKYCQGDYEDDLYYVSDVSDGYCSDADDDKDDILNKITKESVSFIDYREFKEEYTKDFNWQYKNENNPNLDALPHPNLFFSFDSNNNKSAQKKRISFTGSSVAIIVPKSKRKKKQRFANISDETLISSTQIRRIFYKSSDKEHEQSIINMGNQQIPSKTRNIFNLEDWQNCYQEGKGMFIKSEELKICKMFNVCDVYIDIKNLY